MKIAQVGTVRCRVGEGPLWDEREQALYFVDLLGRLLWRHDPATSSFASWAMPQPLAAITLDEAGGMLVALADGFYAFDRTTGSIAPRALPALAAGTQFNDGKVDRQRRFVAGTMERSMTMPLGALFQLAGTQAVELDTGFVIANGPCWSPDGRTLYCADSVPRIIYAYDYDIATGTPANRRRFADTVDLGGIPDGATIDADGRMWMAICGGGKVVSFTPAGTIETIVDMPTPWVSSVMFGGPALDRLYVTSLDPTEIGLPPDPCAGFLYAIDDLGTTGLPEKRARI